MAIPVVRVHPPSLSLSGDLPYDVSILLSANVNSLLSLSLEDHLGPISLSLKDHIALDPSVSRPGEDSSDRVHLLKANCPGKRLVFLRVSLSSDTDDVRILTQAVKTAMKTVLRIGAKSPLILLHHIPPSLSFLRSSEAVVLSALASLYQPLQARESQQNEGEKEEKDGLIDRVGVVFHRPLKVDAEEEDISKYIGAVEAGRIVARDIGGSDPERMSPERIVQYIENTFRGTSVSVQVVGPEELEKEYPLAHAVARCSYQVPRHTPRIVRLTYRNETENVPVRRIMFAGKGVVYDTGGADIKTDGHMKGMSRDKCGAANITGFFKVLAELQPKGLYCYAELGYVRNSCGADSYVADEVIRGHSGIRVQIINTDAEGRLVLADCLSHIREMIEKNEWKDTQVFSCATLTGHAVRSVGCFSIAMDNGPAREKQVAISLQRLGELYGDPLEVSVIRREDFLANEGKSKTHDLRNLGTPVPEGSRGHQFAAAFLAVASKIDQHGLHSPLPIAYTHLDIAGGALEGGDYAFGVPTGSPILSLAAKYILEE